MAILNYNTISDAYQQNVANSEGWRNQVMGGYDKQFNDFNQASGALSQAYSDRYNRGMGYMNDLGMSQQYNLNQGKRNALDIASMNATNSGLGGWARNSMQQGVLQNYQNQQRDLGAQMAGMRASTDANLSGDWLGYAGSAISQGNAIKGAKLGYMGSWHPVDAMSQYMAMRGGADSPFTTTGGGGGVGGGRGGGSMGGGFGLNPGASNIDHGPSTGSRAMAYYGGSGGAPATSGPGGTGTRLTRGAGGDYYFPPGGEQFGLNPGSNSDFGQMSEDDIYRFYSQDHYGEGEGYSGYGDYSGE